MKLEANIAISRLYGSAPDKYAAERVIYELSRKWLEGSAPAITLHRPAKLMQTDHVDSEREFRWIGASGLTLDFMPAQETEIKCLTMDALVALCRDFIERTGCNPTHLLLPPHYHTTFPHSYYEYQALKDSPGTKNQFGFMGLQIVPNAPRLAVAVL